jgi:hypothetical protein
VRDGDGGAAVHEAFERGLHEAFAGGVQGAGRLVEDEDARVGEQHPRDSEPLLLPAGQAVAALADGGVPAGVQPADALADVRGLGRRGQLVVGGVGPAVAQVVPDGRVEQVGLLRHDADRAAERGQRQVADVVAVELHAAGVDVVQARHEVGGGGLACAARPDEGHQRTGGHVEADAVQRPRPVGVVPEADVLEADVALDVALVDGDG